MEDRWAATPARASPEPARTDMGRECPASASMARGRRHDGQRRRVTQVTKYSHRLNRLSPRTPRLPARRRPTRVLHLGTCASTRVDQRPYTAAMNVVHPLLVVLIGLSCIAVVALVVLLLVRSSRRS